ncbi:acyl-CoA N-acyltransferase [Ceratobasidium sp. AG-I]|nr:acyl-CoA N-acyltransferase [Ceratobasidium sp. AG-I]
MTTKRERPAAEVVVASDETEVQQCIQMRIDVFHHEQKFPLDTEVDEYDEPGRAVHFLLRSTTHDRRPIGTLRVVEKAQGFKLGRLCVLKEYRGMYFGEDLVRSAHSWAIVQAERTGRPAEISLHSQIQAKTFYSREGYVSEGPEFDEEGAPHQLMIWRAPKPTLTGADTERSREPIESN